MVCVVVAERLRQLIEELHTQPTRNTKILAGNEQFRRGDRVIVRCDPDHFKQMQTERYGGWNDDMPLVCVVVVLPTTTTTVLVVVIAATAAVLGVESTCSYV